MSYENKVMQLKQMLGKKKTDVKEKPVFQKPDKPVYIAKWQEAGLAVVENDFGVLFKRQVEYPLQYKHGHYELGLFYKALEKWQSTGAEHPYLIDIDEEVLFFDTETTGLKGVGTNIFLLGLLEPTDKSFILNQYVLADPSNEAALLFESKFWQHSKTVVSYNGKSFDWPQLETRWTLNQQFLPKLRVQKQIDLLHSSKRIWKNNLERMKLTQVEEEKLGFKRKGDIPGFLAPIIYADAVKSGDATNLMKVLYHNEWDLLSLVTLYIHSTNLLLENDLKEAATTYTNIGKWYGDLKQQQQSKQILVNVTNEFDDEEAGLAYYFLAFQHKRNRRYEEARHSFEKALKVLKSREKLKVLEQLAILHEHHFKEFKQALFYAEEGLRITSSSTLFKKDQQVKKLEEWKKRYTRIEKKLGK
ncbi:ribonuclease H-like domain-containing protein [Lysinibacillus telephonicus]|uniref:Exonuclease n=1 Tax=Lysinibacillus telephonicus TaxID=1714840 RepID=A0A431US89_9BACI|nr:ribonuclease H-like domain-containing protein [Lysinibacillus telephonicus]RTQ93217.1 exonuclease [Lysinibacillus telephonicus]